MPGLVQDGEPPVFRPLWLFAGNFSLPSWWCIRIACCVRIRRLRACTATRHHTACPRPYLSAHVRVWRQSKHGRGGIGHAKNEIQQRDFAISATVGHVSSPIKSKAAAPPFDPSNPFSYRLEGVKKEPWTEIPLQSMSSMKEQTAAKHSTHARSMQSIPPLFQIDDDLSAYSTRHASAATSSTPSLAPSRHTSNQPSPRNKPPADTHWHYAATMGTATQPFKSSRLAYDQHVSQWNADYFALSGPTAVTEYTKPEFAIRFV